MEEVFDRVVVPALVLAERDRLRRDIGDDDHAFVVAAGRRIVEGIDPSAGPVSEGGGPKAVVLAAAARSDADDLAVTMLARLVAPLDCEVTTVPSGALATIDWGVQAPPTQEPTDVVHRRRRTRGYTA